MMKRFGMMMATASTLILVGCGVRDYNKRIELTVERLKYEQAINTYLMPPAEGKFKELNVFLRLPKPSNEIGAGFAPPAGQFDQVASYQAQPSAPAAKEGTAPVNYAPLKIHVFVRQKPKKAATKKGEAPPPEINTAARGNFITDVRTAIASEYGADAATEKAPQVIKVGDTSFKRLIFASGATGNDVQVYFAETNKGELESALVFDIPKSIRTHAIVTKGVDYSLRSFGLGGGARKAAAAGPAAAGEKPSGPAF